MPQLWRELEAKGSSQLRHSTDSIAKGPRQLANTD